MKNIGLMMTKNEAPILDDTLGANTRFMKDILVLYGGDDDTEKVLKKYDEVKFMIHERELVAQGKMGGNTGNGIGRGKLEVKDGVRGLILKEILKQYEEGDWITLMHGDEIFYHDPNAAAAMATKTGYNTVVWFALHFFLTKSDLENWRDLAEKPLEQRITWYATNEYPWTECRQFRISADTRYELDTHSRTAPQSDNIRILPSAPVLKHYKVWDPDPSRYESVWSEKYGKMVSKEKGKWGKLPWEVKRFEDFFIDLYPGYSEKHRLLQDRNRFEEHFNDCLEQFKGQLSKQGHSVADVIANAPVRGSMSHA